MSVETKPNKLVKGLVLDTFHTDVDNTVATYALNSQLEDQEGNHFHYGSEVGTTFIKNIPDTHVVVGHINMERNETVLFTTDGTNSTIGILSRNDDMSYQYEIKVDDTKQTKKLGFKKNIYIRGVYRLLNGCDKIIYFVDGINKDRRINLNQLDSYKLPTTVTSAILFVVTTAIIRSTSTLTGDIKIIRVLSPTNIFTQSNVVANLIREVNFQSNLSSNSLLVSNINFVQKVASSLNANASLSGDINFVQKAQASLLATGTTTADLTVNAPSDSLLLDLYPNAATAYSLRKLRTAYTGSAVRVRASTSGAEGDVSFDVNSTISASSTVTITAVGTSGLSIGQQVTFSTFWNAGGSNQNVFVTTWYDQSGNARDAAQTTQANQPQIVSSGVIILSGSRPSISFDDINDFMVNNMISITSNFSLIAVINSDSKDFSVYYGSNKDIEFGTTIGYVLDAYRIQSESSILIIQPVSLLYSLFFNYRNDTSGFLYQNNSLKGQGNVSGNFELQVIGGRQTQNNLYYDGKIQELITYTNNQSSNRVAIETNINTHYEIY